MTEEISIEEIKRLDAERTQKDWGICYGGLGVFWADRENDARFITSSPRIAAKCIALDEEVGSLKQQLFIAVQDFVHWRNASLEMRNNLEQLRAENERLRGALARHHQWQLDCERVVVPGTAGEEMVIDCEYHESSMCEQTILALEQSPAPAKEDKTNGGWLDISSVPKDKWVLVNRAMYSGRAIAQLIDETDKGYGMTWFDDEMNVLEFVPRFWQPLPA